MLIGHDLQTGKETFEEERSIGIYGEVFVYI